MAVLEKMPPTAVYKVDNLLRQVTPVTGSSAVFRTKGWYQNPQDHVEIKDSIILEWDPAQSTQARTMKFVRLGEKCAFYANDVVAGCTGYFQYGAKFGLDVDWRSHQDPQYNDWGWNSIPGVTNIDPLPARSSYKELKLSQNLQISAGFSFTGGWDSSGVYNYDIWVDVDLTTNKPYMEVYWEDVVPESRPIAPTGFTDDRKEILFKWSYSGGQSYSGRYNAQLGAVVEWKVKGTDDVHQIQVTGSAHEITVPPNTLPTQAEIQWRVLLDTQFGKRYHTDWADITTRDALPAAPLRLHPDNVRVDNSSACILSWSHTVATGSAQQAAELQISSDHGASWQPLGAAQGVTQQYTALANSLPAGNVWWRVRTANTDGAFGDWASAQIIVRSAPRPPIITNITTTPRPTVSWQAADQQGWQVIAVDAHGTAWDSGVHYGQDKSVKCQIYLAAGTCMITVKICNQLGLWAELAETIRIQNGTAPRPMRFPPAVSVDDVGFSIVMDVSGYNRYYLLRNGKPIAASQSPSFRDLVPNISTQYEIMGVYGNHSDYYAISSAAGRSVRPGKDTLLVDMETMQSLRLHLHRDRPPVISGSIHAEADYCRFAGQQYPVAQGHDLTELLTLEYTVTHDELVKLREMIGQVICVRLRDGARFFAVLDSIQANLWKRTDVALQFTRVEYTEEIPYE